MKTNAIQKLIIQIAGEDSIARMSDMYGDFANNHSWMREFALLIGVQYIESAEQFEDEYTARIKDLTDKQLSAARANGVLPCVKDSDGELVIAIGSLHALDVEMFAFSEIVLVPLETISAYLPVLVSGEFDQIENVKQYVEALLIQGWEMRASDIHIEAETGVYVVKYRIDGNITPIISTRKPEFMENAMAVFQKMARVEVRSGRPYQDGQIIFSFKGKKTEWRYHEDRTIAGRRVVIRQSHAHTDKSTLETLRYPAEVAAMIREVSEKKSGMILFCGPTGQGKSTVMITELIELRKKFNWLITMIEDNPEVILDGISQVPVFEDGEGQYKYGYAEAIRATLRADVDVLMVAEIRDSLTAIAAFRASMTGHFAMSTIHVNSIDSVVPRLRDLGVDSHTVYSRVSGIFVQFLIPALCPKCKINIGENHFKKGVDESCPTCDGKGYFGRVPINECAVLAQGRNDFIRKRYFSFPDTLNMQFRDGNIDEVTIKAELASMTENEL